MSNFLITQYCTIQQILQMQLDSNDDMQICEIRPKYIIPDTNCYIDDLTTIKKIIHHGYFTVCVPIAGWYIIVICSRPINVVHSN